MLLLCSTRVSEPPTGRANRALRPAGGRSTCMAQGCPWGNGCNGGGMRRWAPAQSQVHTLPGAAALAMKVGMLRTHRIRHIRTRPAVKERRGIRKPLGWRPYPNPSTLPTHRKQAQWDGRRNAHTAHAPVCSVKNFLANTSPLVRHMH